MLAVSVLVFSCVVVFESVDVIPISTSYEMDSVLITICFQYPTAVSAINGGEVYTVIEFALFGLVSSTQTSTPVPLTVSSKPVC